MVPPAPPLRSFVECLWVHAVPTAEDLSDFTILPDGRMDLVWTRQNGVGVAGPQTQYLVHPLLSPLVAYGVRFHPGAAPTFLRVPASQLRDGHTTLDGIEPRLARRLDERLGEARNEHEAFAILNAELLRRLDRLHAPDAAVREAVSLLDAATATVAGVAARVFLSERQLQRRFTEHVGYGPKTLQRILRLQRVIDRLGEGAGFAQAAASAGYSDQSHLFRESRRLAGLTPGELVAYRH